MRATRRQFLQIVASLAAVLGFPKVGPAVDLPQEPGFLTCSDPWWKAGDIVPSQALTVTDQNRLTDMTYYRGDTQVTAMAYFDRVLDVEETRRATQALLDDDRLTISNMGGRLSVIDDQET